VLSLVRLETRPSSGGTVVEVVGELDVSTCPELGDAVDAAWDACGDLTIDLRGATFADSTLIRLLAGARRRARADGRALDVVCADGGQPARLLALTGAAR